MSSAFSRRRVLAAGAGAALGFSAFGAAGASASPDGAPHPGGPEEARTLDALYQAALREGGKLVIYAGGDTPTQQDGTKAAFKARFPDIDLTLIVDYSKYHDVRNPRFLTRAKNFPAFFSFGPHLVPLDEIPFPLAEIEVQTVHNGSVHRHERRRACHSRRASRPTPPATTPKPSRSRPANSVPPP